MLLLYIFVRMLVHEKTGSLYIQKMVIFYFPSKNGSLPYSIPSLSPSFSHHTPTRRNVLEFDFFVPIQVFFNTILEQISDDLCSLIALFAMQRMSSPLRFP